MRRKARKLDTILVIQLGGLGEFVQAMAACKTIREYHYDAKITLLTTPPYAPLAQVCPYFNTVWENGQPKGISGTLKLGRKIRKAKFDRIYDLQTDRRSNRFYRLLWPFRPEWSGVAPGCSHPHKNRKRGKMHFVDRQAEQLAMAGVGLGRGRVGDTAPPPDLDWVRDVQRGAARTELTWFGVRKPFALLVPGSAAKSPGKRWPAEHYGALAMRLRRAGVMPVIIGTDLERESAYVIQKTCPGALSLINRTDYIQIVMLARQAELAVGNDTGPMHLIASANCPSLVLFSSESNPDLCAPRGQSVTILSKKKIAEIGIGEVWEKIQNLPQGHQNEHSLPPQNAHLSQKKDIAEEQDGAKDEEGE